MENADKLYNFFSKSTESKSNLEINNSELSNKRVAIT